MNTVVETAFLSLCAEPRFITDRRGVQAQVVVKEWHRVAYSDCRPQGEPKGTVVCVHGFSRNRHDFHMLAQALSGDGWRVVCPDMPGRGPGREEGKETSDWLGDQTFYDNSQYMLDCMALIARLGVPHVHWIGTSMGGLLGMLLAAQPNTPIRSLVMNDVGPSVVPKAAREHIAAYTSADASFDKDKEEKFAAYVRETYQGFEPLTEEQWRHLIEHSRRRRADGTLGLAFDPKIGLQLKKQLPSRAKLVLCRFSGRCSPYLPKITSASRLGPARPRAMGWNGAGVSLIVSQQRQETFSRTCWITNQRARSRQRRREVHQVGAAHLLQHARNQKPQRAALRLALPRELRLQLRNHATRNILNPTHPSNPA